MKGYRTLIFNFLMGAVILLSQTLGFDAPEESQVNQFLDALDVIMSVVTVIGNIFFRFISDTSIGRKT